MERPTCKTCPYWLIEDDDFNPITLEECLKLPDAADPDDWNFECKRYPRRKPLHKHGSDFCGEHPDFKAYIASLRPMTGHSRLYYRILEEQELERIAEKESQPASSTPE